MRQHQGDGLRMLIVDELCQLLGVGFLNRVEGGGVGAERFGEAVQQTLGLIRLESAHQQLAGILYAAAGHVVAGIGDMMELFEHDSRPAPPRWPSISPLPG